MQLATSFTLEDLSCKHQWLSYSEPESHITPLSIRVSAALRQQSVASIAGLTWKDESLLEQIGNFITDDIEHSTILFTRSGMSSQQICLDTADVVRAVQEGVDLPSEAFDLLIARHSLEHATDVRLFLRNLASMVKTSGMLLIEVPDCSIAFVDRNYASLWEEHYSYFTSESLQMAIASAGLTIRRVEQVVSDREAVLIAECGTQLRGESKQVDSTSFPINDDAFGFVSQFDARRNLIRNSLNELTSHYDSIHIFGANHVASNFIDLFCSAHDISSILDDNEHKVGRLMSKFRLPIVLPSEWPKSEFPLFVIAIHPGRAKDLHLSSKLRDVGFVFQIHIDDLINRQPGSALKINRA